MQVDNILIPIPNADPTVLFEPNGLEHIIERIEAEARSLVPDLSTAASRRQIASNAARVASSKTYLDSLGKDYVAKLKELPKVVDAERRRMRERLDALRDEVRAPLTEFEQREQAKEYATLDAIRTCQTPIPFGATSEWIAAQIQAVSEIWATTDEGFLDQDQRLRVNAAKADALPVLHRALEEAKVREAQESERAAELERLRAEQLKHEAENQARRLAKEAIERERHEAVRRLLAAEQKAAQERAEAANRIADLERERVAEKIERERQEEAKRRADQALREEQATRMRIIATIATDICNLINDPAVIDVLTYEDAEALANAMLEGHIRHVRVVA